MDAKVAYGLVFFIRAVLDLIKGRYPKLTIAAPVNGANGGRATARQKTALDNERLKELILEQLRVHPATRAELVTSLDDALPKDMCEPTNFAPTSRACHQR